jgi:hypothetical protein
MPMKVSQLIIIGMVRLVLWSPYGDRHTSQETDYLAQARTADSRLRSCFSRGSSL